MIVTRLYTAWPGTLEIIAQVTKQPSSCRVIQGLFKEGCLATGAAFSSLMPGRSMLSIPGPPTI